MKIDLPAELRFPDDGTVAYGILAACNSQTLTVRLIEQLNCDLFVYGRMAHVVVPTADGLVSAPCRLVAQREGGMWRELIAVITMEPTITQRRVHPRFPCNLEAVYRAISGPQSFGAWRPANVMEISREGIGIRIQGARMRLHHQTEFPKSVELKVTVPEAMANACEPDVRIVAIVRHGSTMRQEGARPIRLRADTRSRRRDGEDTLVGLQFQALAPCVERRIDELLGYLEQEEARQLSTPPKIELDWVLDILPPAGQTIEAHNEDCAPLPPAVSTSVSVEAATEVEQPVLMNDAPKPKEPSSFFWLCNSTSG